MKIAFLSFYSGKIDRGVEVAVDALASKFHKKHQITVFQSGNRKNTGYETEVLDVNFDSSQDKSNSFWRKGYLDYNSLKIAFFTLKFIKYFFKNRYDLVIPTNGGWQILICRLLTWVYGKKMIVQGNAGIGRDDLWQLACFPDHFVAISPQGYAWIKDKAVWIKKSYIPYGVDNESFLKTDQIKLPLKKPIVLCVSAFVPYKQIDMTIKAMVKVSEASLLVIGQGIEEQKLRLLGKKLLGDRFLLLTGIKHKDLLSYYKSVNVFTLASKSTEALGIVYIEAMAAGLPVVAPDDQLRHQIIGKPGYYFNPLNIDDYSDKIRLALKAANQKEFIEQSKKYSWDKISNEYELLFQKL